MTIRQFKESDSLLANPGQGFMTMRPAPEGEMRFPYTVVYRSFTWADAEPEQGKINWALIDDVIKAWRPRGATVAFRVMTCNAHSRGYYSSPKWLFDEGCKGFEFMRSGATFGGIPITRIEPDYSDPVYLKRHGEFIAALGRRYDGNPDIEFIDIGSYGIWGEWHTPNSAPLEVRKQIVDFYLNAFKKTQLIFLSDGAELLEYGLENGTGMRRDGVGSTWHEQNWIGSERYADVPSMAEAWKHEPVVFEWYGRYDHLLSQGWSFDAAVNFVLANHVTIMNDNVGRVPEEDMPQLQKIARLAGARFVLRELAHKTNVKSGDSLRLDMKWANVGVGRLYYPYRLRLFITDTTGATVVSANAVNDPCDWLPGEYTVREMIKIPDALVPGDYEIALALEDPGNYRRPFLLAIDVQPKEGRYVLSNIQVR
jgi:hypothetical protein